MLQRGWKSFWKVLTCYALLTVALPMVYAALISSRLVMQPGAADESVPQAAETPKTQKVTEAVEQQPVAEVKIPEMKPVEQPVVEVKIPETEPVEQPVILPVLEPAASSTEPAIVQTPSAEKEDNEVK